MAHRPRIDAFLRQATGEHSRPESSDAQLLDLAASLERALQAGRSEILEGEEVPAQGAEDPPAHIEPGPSAIPALHLSV